MIIMDVLKVVFVIMLCIPLLYMGIMLARLLVREIVAKQQTRKPKNRERRRKV